MNSRIYPEDLFIDEAMKKIEREKREKNLFVRKVLIEKNNKIELYGVLQRVVDLSINK